MTALSYLARRFPGQNLEPETELRSLRGFDLDDLGGLIIAIEMATEGRITPTDAQAMAWQTIVDVLMCEAQGERKAA